MKSLFSIIAFCITINSFGQYQQFPKLEQLRQKKAWTKILKKASKLTEANQYKKEPVPHFYKAEALLQISLDPKLNAKYDNAFKQCVKATLKACKLNELGSGSLKFTRFETLFETEGNKIAQAYVKQEKYNRALPIYEAIYALDINNLHAQSNRGLIEIHSNAQQGYETLGSVIRKLSNPETAQKTTMDSTILATYTVFTSHLLTEAIIDSAYKTIQQASQHFSQNKEIEDLYFVVLKNYIQFFNHYNKYSEALKIAVQGANNFPGVKAFVKLEEQAMIKFTDAQIIYGKFDYIESIWTNYTTRKRDPNLLDNLQKTNYALVQLIAEYHHIHQPKIAKLLIQSLYDVNKNIQTKRNPNQIYSFKQWGNDLCNTLNKQNEFYLAYTVARYLKLYVSDDPELKELENNTRAKLNDFKLTLSGQADLYLDKKEANLEEYLNLLEGFAKVKSYDKAYRIIKKANQQFPNETALKAIEKQIIIDDYHINFKGSRLIKQYFEGQIIDELQWKGNLKKCKPGTIHETAHAKTIQRINYFRRFAGIDIESKFVDDLNIKAQKIAFDLYPENECKESGLASQTAGLQFNGAHTSNAVLNMMMATTDAGSRSYILNPNNKLLGHGSTDENFVLIHDEMQKNNPTYDTMAIAWPPEGMVPAELIYGRWSFSLANADFSKAKVKMKVFGRDIPKENIEIDEFDPKAPGIPTLSWIPKGIILYAQMDLTYDIEISGVRFPGQEQGHGFRYKVTVIQSK